MEFFGSIFLTFWFIRHVSMLNLKANVKYNDIYVEIHLPGTCISNLENEGVDQMLPKGVSNTCAV